jgi:RNA polymerase sigma factor (TIGR02999 family)
MDSNHAMGEVSLLLNAASGGDRAAGDRAFALVYADLQRLARRQVQRSSAGPGATSLVHEVYLRLARPEALDVSSREHFFALAARAMRQLVVDHARQRSAAKRGGGVVPEALDEIHERIGALGDAERLLGLDQALQRLTALDSHLARLVEMRFFAGLELEEIAAITGRSERSLKRDWRKARAVLHANLEGGLLSDE